MLNSREENTRLDSRWESEKDLLHLQQDFFRNLCISPQRTEQVRLDGPTFGGVQLSTVRWLTLLNKKPIPTDAANCLPRKLTSGKADMAEDQPHLSETPVTSTL